MTQWKRYNPIGAEEKAAVKRVFDSGVLSQYIGAWHEDFNGGTEVRAFERELARFFGTAHAVVFNSLTSGLIAAVGAMGIKPALIEAAISERSKGIVVADIFGHGCLLDEIKAIADQNKLFLIEDVAQAPGVKMSGRFLGTWGDIGGFSLNYHKHIHTGEGGFCICRDETVAMKMRLIRNHAESAVAGSPINELHNMVGFNFRMGEMEAAIGREQLKKLPRLLAENQSKAEIILNALKQESWLVSTPVKHISEHAYYVLPFRIMDHSVDKAALISALQQRGVPGLIPGYVNIHRLPMYVEQTAFGQFPWQFNLQQKYNYGDGVAPVAEALNDRWFFGLLISMFDMSPDDCQWIAAQLKAVYRELTEGNSK
ncbi:MAG: DegT/DnrJ/EryC1/StrS family aminotransferase [Reinekea sp.]